MSVRWLVPPGESRPLSGALQSLMIATRSERGCVGCTLSTDMGTRVVISYIEDWQTEDDLKRQLRSERFRTLAELMEKTSEQPVVRFIVHGTTRGLEYAEDVRGQKSR